MKKLNPYVLMASIVFFAMYVLQALWRPWTSADAAAKYLVQADGIGLTAMAPIAARFWGGRIYAPLAERTERFHKLTHYVELTTLLEVLERDRPDSVALVLPELLRSKSPPARMLGLMAGKIHGLPVPDRETREREVINILVQRVGRGTFDVDDTYVQIGMRVIGKAKIAGAVPVLRMWVQSASPNYSHIIDACDALASVPEKEAAAHVLAEGLTGGRFVPASHCAQSLVTIIGARAAPAIRNALRIETDNDEVKRLRKLLQKIEVA